MQAPLALNGWMILSSDWAVGYKCRYYQGERGGAIEDSGKVGRAQVNGWSLTSFGIQLTYKATSIKQYAGLSCHIPASYGVGGG